MAMSLVKAKLFSICFSRASRQLSIHLNFKNYSFKSEVILVTPELIIPCRDEIYPLVFSQRLNQNISNRGTPITAISYQTRI